MATAPSISPQITASSDVPLPVDVLFEAITATLIICFGLVLDSPRLRPIRWRVWAGRVEREGARGLPGGSDGGSSLAATGNPFRMLEMRPGFVDIRHQRKEFSQWAKESDGISS